jgi:hypothetical protein
LEDAEFAVRAAVEFFELGEPCGTAAAVVFQQHIGGGGGGRQVQCGKGYGQGFDVHEFPVCGFRRRLLTRRMAIVTKKTALDKQNAVLLLPIRA